MIDAIDPSSVGPACSAGAEPVVEHGAVGGVDIAEPKLAQVPPGATITPLSVPWLHHDSYPTVKKVCSESGLPQAKKTSVVRVLQELKRGRNRIDQQLAHLESQLLHVSDFLSGATPTLEIAADPSSAAADDDVAYGVGDLHEEQRNGKVPATASGEKSTPIDPVATLVEEDLATDAPCTTVGLWRYLSVFQFFKTVTLEDMQEALLLEDPALAVAAEANEADAADAADAYESGDGLSTINRLPEGHSNGQRSITTKPTVHELLRLRLLAALVPEETIPDIGHVENEDLPTSDVKADGDVDMNLAGDEQPLAENGYSEHGNAAVKKADRDMVMSLVDDEPLAEPWQPATRTLQQLRDIGLVEATTDEIRQSLTRRQDDEVSTEIRLLQSELVRQVRRNNEGKRTLRRALERLKPWLTHDDEYLQIETKFEKMWRRKKELQRKKKHKEKKLQRKEASYKSAFLMPPKPPGPP